MKSPLEQFDIINIKSIYIINSDFSFNNILIPLFILIILLISIIYLFINLKNLKLVPSYIQILFEVNYLFVLNLIKQQANNYGLFWLPILFCLFNFILICNLLSLLPFGIALTSHLILIFWLSSTICSSIFLIGLYRFKLKFLHIFIPSCPFVLMPVLIPIEMFSYFIRLFSLAIRLAANILAGHTLVHIIVTFIMNVLKIDFILAIIVLIPLFLILILECGVAMLQAYVFTVLICIYLADTEKIAAH